MTRASSPLEPSSEIWRNWPESVPAGPPQKFRPTNIAQLVDVAKRAQSGFRLRASGTRWSSSSASRADHAWIDTSGLDRILSRDLTQLADQAVGNVANLVLVQAGVKIHHLATELWPTLSLKTLGGSMGQSVAGAISTGTHGTDIDLPPIEGMVRAIHLVTAGGHEYWLEDPEHPIATMVALRQHYEDWDDSIKCPRDAKAFKAALVSAGRCGVVYAYVLEVEPAYQLRAERGRSSWVAVKTHLTQAAASGNWRQFIRTRPLPFNESTTVRTGGAPAPVVAEDRLSLAWGGTNQPGYFRWIHRDNQGGTWSRKRMIDDGRRRWSNHPPAVAFFQGRYYLAWTGTNANHPYLHLMRSTDGTGAYWERHIRFDGSHPNRPEAKSRTSPVLLAANGRLHLVWVGTNSPGHFRWITSTNGMTWGDKRLLTDPLKVRESHYRPSLAFYEGRYYLAWTGTNPAHPYVHLIRSNNSAGTSWGSHIRFDGSSPTRPQAMSRDAPQILSANGRLHLTWVGTNSPGAFRWITSVNGVNWGDKRILTDAGQDRRSNHSPALTFHRGRYHLFWREPTSAGHVHSIASSDSSGRSWGSHDKLDVPPGPDVDLTAMRALDVALSPFGADGNAWWTIKTTVGTDATPTRPTPPMRAADQRMLVRALAKALDPNVAVPASTAAGFLSGLALGGPLGAIIGGIAGAITAGAVADSGDVFAAIADLIFNGELNSPDTTGPSFEVSSGSAFGYAGGYRELYGEFWRDNPRTQYTEIFFDAQRSDYLAFVDAALAYFRGTGTKHAGYIAIRFMQPSRAPLAMQRWPVTAAVEIVLLQDLDPNALHHIKAVNELARRYDVRFHLGMTRPMEHRSAGINEELEEWKQGARKLGVVASDGFSSEFSRAAGLEPERRRDDHLLIWGSLSPG